MCILSFVQVDQKELVKIYFYRKCIISYNLEHKYYINKDHMLVI